MHPGTMVLESIVFLIPRNLPGGELRKALVDPRRSGLVCCVARTEDHINLFIQGTMGHSTLIQLSTLLETAAHSDSIQLS